MDRTSPSPFTVTRNVLLGVLAICCMMFVIGATAPYWQPRIPKNHMRTARAGASFSKCKGKNILQAAYEGGGMVSPSGKLVYLSVCDSGEIQYDLDYGAAGGAIRTETSRLSGEQQHMLTQLLDSASTGSLRGRYSGVMPSSIDYWVFVDFTVVTKAGSQKFTVDSPYGDTAKTYPASLVNFLCRIDDLRRKATWRISEKLRCN